jgi:hypothetical protein
VRRAGVHGLMRARPFKERPPWHISSFVSTHMCESKDLDEPNVKDVHRQLSYDFITYKLSNSIKTLLTVTIRQVVDMMKSHFGYEVKYWKARKVKLTTFRIVYGDWEHSSNQLP